MVVADVPVFGRSTARPPTGISPISTSLALSGAAMFCIEATHVEAIGRITPGCLGLWNDATEAALKPILASVRKHSKTAVAMQLAHAGRKGSSHTPWDGGQQIPLAEGGWQTRGAVRGAAQGGRSRAARARCGGAGAHPRRLCRRRQARRAARHRRARTALRARLSAASVPVADLQQAHRPIWRLAAKPHALSARGVRRGARGVSRDTSRSASGCPRPTGSRAAGTSRRPSNLRRS